MKRKAFDPDAYEGPSLTERAPLRCRYCGDETTYATLSTCGARCLPCYEAYCRAAPASRPPSHAALAIRAKVAKATPGAGDSGEPDRDEQLRREDAKRRAQQAVDAILAAKRRR